MYIWLLETCWPLVVAEGPGMSKARVASESAIDAKQLATVRPSLAFAYDSKDAANSAPACFRSPKSALPKPAASAVAALVPVPAVFAEASLPVSLPDSFSSPDSTFAPELAPT